MKRSHLLDASFVSSLNWVQSTIICDHRIMLHKRVHTVYVPPLTLKQLFTITSNVPSLVTLQLISKAEKIIIARAKEAHKHIRFQDDWQRRRTYVQLCGLWLKGDRLCSFVLSWKRTEKKHVKCKIIRNVPSFFFCTGVPEIIWNAAMHLDILATVFFFFFFFLNRQPF